MSPLFRSLASGLLASVLASGGAATTELSQGYSIRLLQTDQGLPQNHVTSAVQTRDGYLWFGTHGGLARFDGERFRVFTTSNTPQLQDRRIARLFEDAQGTLWIGHESGAITRFRDDRFDIYAPAPGRENDRIFGLGSDERGRMWAMRESGVVESLDGGPPLPSLIEHEHPGLMIWARTPGGTIWVSENGRAARLEQGALVAPGFEPGRYDQTVVAVAGTADGGVWIARDGLIRKWKDNRWVEDRGKIPWPGPVACSLELHDGTLAVGTTLDGLFLIYPDNRPVVRLDRSNGLPQNWVRFLYEDREGNLWAGIGNAGLVSIRTTPFSVLDSPDRWKGCTVLSVAPGRDNALWIGTDGAGVYHYAAGTWSHYGAAEGLGNEYIWSVAETPEGSVWAGNYWWGGPYRLEDGRFVRPPSVDERWSPAVALLPVPDTGELLVGNRDGLLRLKDGEPARWLIHSPVGSNDDVTAIARDRSGALWCGFAAGGLARLADEKTTLYGRDDGLGTSAVQCLFADDDGALWIGTADAGLVRLKDGRFSTVRRERGLASNGICYILDDGLGSLWLSTHHGIQRVSKNELNRCADGTLPKLSSRIYDREDGLPVIEFTGGRQAAGCRTPDGRLWFASSRGLLSVDPARVGGNSLPPPVVFDSFIVDDRNVPIDGHVIAGRLRPNHERLEFRYSGLSYTAPRNVLFKYQLEGIDQTWVEAGSRRTAFYSRLPAGTYRFRVIACNSDGVWNSTGTFLEFAVAPFVWQTWWFVTLCTLAGISGVAVLVRFITRRRMQRRIQQLERKHAVERERARIARDIHDDVGASLARIAMLSQPGRSEPIESPRTVAMLGRIYSTAREMTRSLDEIVWAVDPRHDTLDSLVSYIGEFAQDFLAAADIRCRLDPPVELPAWRITADKRHNLFLAFKEALSNVLRHAHATEVRVSLALQADSFVLTIQDNGRGIAPAGPDVREPGRIASGHGLSNMERRLAGIGGRCEIASTPGKGTTISFFVEVTGPVDPLVTPPGATGNAATTSETPAKTHL